MYRTNCPYCGEYNELETKLDEQYTSKIVECDSCHKKYNINFHVSIIETGLKEELLASIPQDKIDCVKNACKEFLGKKRGTVEINKGIDEKLVSNEYVVSLSAKNNSYGITDYRTVKFYVSTDGSVNPKVLSEFMWIEKQHFKGDTLTEKVNNYIEKLLLEWHII